MDDLVEAYMDCHLQEKQGRPLPAGDQFTSLDVVDTFGRHLASAGFDDSNCSIGTEFKSIPCTDNRWESASLV